MTNQRIPNQRIYNLILTICLAVLIIWGIYILIPIANYRLYFLK